MHAKEISVIICLLMLVSCAKDIKTTAPYKEIVIVQAVLNAGDTAQYVGIKKAFGDSNKSAFDMAKEPDSSFFKDLQVTIVESEGSVIKNVIAGIMVDMAAEGYPKDEGLFFTNPNYAFKFKYAMNLTRSYRLLIEHSGTGRIDSSFLFKIVDERITNRNIHYDSINFSGRNTDAVLTLSGICPLNAAYIQSNIRLHYTDSNINTGERTLQTLLLKISDTIMEEKKNYVFRKGTDDILNTIQANIPPATKGQVRLMDSCELWTFAGGQELADYYGYLHQDLFIRSDMSNPVYTNMMTADAYGVISSCAVFGNAHVKIDNATMEVLLTDEKLRPLNFIGRTTY